MRNLPLLRFSIWYMATVLDHSDVEDQRTVTGDYAQKSWVFKNNPKPLRTFQHYRLVLQEIGRSLTVFNDFREMLAAMRSALQGKYFQIARWFFLLMYLAAHRKSYYNGYVLHRDISAGNIIIYKNGGLLIDWDMSKDLDLQTNEKNISRIIGYIFRILDFCAYYLLGFLGLPITPSFQTAEGRWASACSWSSWWLRIIASCSFLGFPPTCTTWTQAAPASWCFNRAIWQSTHWWWQGLFWCLKIVTHEI